jgi:phytoene synthase
MGQVASRVALNPARVAESYAWSRAIARDRAKNFYYSFRLLSREKHNAICAVYAFMRHCDDLSDEEGATRTAIEAWRGEMRRAIAGELSDHPLWPGFVDAVERYSIPSHVFEDMVDGVLSDLNPRRIETFDELYRYCYQVASVAGLSVIQIFGFTGTDAPLLAEKCGIAFQLTNILRDVREDLDRGRIYLPREDFERFGVDAVEDGPAWRQMLRFEGDRARRYFLESRPLLDRIEPASRPALAALMDIYGRLLSRIEASDYDVLQRRIRVPAWEKAWLMTRAAFGASPRGSGA